MVRALFWLISVLGFMSSPDDGWWSAFVVVALVACVVIDEVDGMRATYAPELWKVRGEANREAILWLKANGTTTFGLALTDGTRVHPATL